MAAGLVADSGIDAELHFLVRAIGEVSRDGEIRADAPFVVVRMLGLGAQARQHVAGRIGRVHVHSTVGGGPRERLHGWPIRQCRVVVGHIRKCWVAEGRVVVVRLGVATLGVAHVIVDGVVAESILAADLGHFRIEVLLLVAQRLTETRRVDETAWVGRVDRRRARESPTENVPHDGLGIPGIVESHEVLIGFVRRVAQIDAVAMPLAVIIVNPLFEAREFLARVGRAGVDESGLGIVDAAAVGVDRGSHECAEGLVVAVAAEARACGARQFRDPGMT